MKKFLFYIVLLVGTNLVAQVKIVYIAAEMDEVHYLDDFTSVQIWG